PNPCDRSPDIIKFLADQICSGEKRVTRDLKDDKWRRFERKHFVVFIEIDLRQIQSPQVAQEDIESKLFPVKFVKVSVFADLSTLKTFEYRIFLRVQVNLGELCCTGLIFVCEKSL